jgi:hypothetical protein
MAHLVFGLTRLTHDMYRKDSGIALLRDSDAVMQTVKTRLLTHFQEWFLDLSAGLPWFTEMCVHNPNFKLVENRVAESIINTDGVVNLISLNLAFNVGTRVLTIDFKYTDVYGSTLGETERIAI